MTNFWSMMEMPGTRRMTSEASLSCDLAICWADMPLCTTKLLRWAATCDASVLRLTVAVTVAVPRLLSSSLMRTTRAVSVRAGLMVMLTR